MNGLCSKCKSFKVDKALYRIKNCPTENSLVAFSHNHKVEAIIVSCKEFLLLPYPRKVEVIPGHEFENDVMKVKERVEGGENNGRKPR